MFQSLRIRLIVTYALIALLSLAIGGAAFLVLLRGYQQERDVARLREHTLFIAAVMQSPQARAAQLTPAELFSVVRSYAEELNLRLLLADSRWMVVEDSEGSLIGRQLDPPQRPLRGSMEIGWFQEAGRPRMLFVATPVLLNTQRGGPQWYVLLVAARPRGMLDAWIELAPHLGRAALFALAGSVLVALAMARLILRPIRSLTEASEAIARGNYVQRIDHTGPDEIGRLAEAFNRMAQEVARSQQMLRDFLANVSHELKTPLTSIQGFSQAMLDGALQTRDEFASAAQIINGEAARMRRLVDDLLFLSKVESGQIPMNRRPIDLGPFLEACVQRLRWQASQREVRIVCDLNGGQPVLPVEADPDRLEQACVNLLENAIRHATPGSEITVRARLTAVPDQAPGGERTRQQGRRLAIAISVHNYGDVIPPEDLPRIFERFYQVDKSRTRRSEGSGLGLAIVKEIVQAHGGAVQATSDAVHGTELTIILPASTALSPELLPAAR